MAPKAKPAAAKNGLFTCCQPKRVGPAPIGDPNEIMIDSSIRDHLNALPMQKELISNNSVVEIQPPKDETSKIAFKPHADTLYDSTNKILAVVIAVPGFVKDEVDVEIERGVLHVSGQCRKSTAAEKYGDSLSLFNRELHYGHFYRTFQLPPNVLEDSADASMVDGILTIKMKCVNYGEKKKVTIH